MKKHLLKMLCLSFLTLIITFTNMVQAYAAESNIATSRTTFEITDIDDEESTIPVDPEYPDYDINPEPDENGDNGTTGNTGALRIDYISKFSLGSQFIQTDDQKFYASLVTATADHSKTDKLRVPNFAQITDLRGTGSGWTLSVKQNSQFSIADGSDAGREIAGARLSLHNITANAPSHETAVSARNESITFDVMDAEQKILAANTEQGRGIHVVHFGEYDQGEKDSALKSVELDIPGNTPKVPGVYQTTLTWILSDVPGDFEEEAELERIEVTTPPNKTSYIEGQKFDPNEMVVTAYYTNGTENEVTDYTLSPNTNTALSTADTAITISYTEDEITKTASQPITVRAKALTSIAITEPPTKREYIEEQTFNKNGMVVTAYYDNGTNKEVPNYTYSPTAALKTTNTAITISYTENGITKTASQPITVKAKTLTSIAVTKKPDKTIYNEGENFNHNGMIVTAYYDNGTNAEAKTYSWTPGTNLQAGTPYISIYYTEKGVTKSTILLITVNPKKGIDEIEDKKEFDEIEIDEDTWIILSKNKTAGTAEIMHKKGLKSLHHIHKATSSNWTWEKSDMRTYLNDTFYKTLSTDFKNSIVKVSKKTLLSRTQGSQTLNETIYLLSVDEYKKYESDFKGTLYNYGLRASIEGWWLRDAEQNRPNGNAYVITNVQSGAAYGHHGAENNQGVRPVVTVKYKK